MIVFVHGVPETAVIWSKVRSLLGRESDAFALLGFGCPRPEGFGGSKDDYADWLVHQLEAYDEPVDLVGHDPAKVRRSSRRRTPCGRSIGSVCSRRWA